MNELNRLVAHVLEQEGSMVEQACERALTGGEHGVKVTRRNGLLASAEPDPSVPYGEIHEHQEWAP